MVRICLQRGFQSGRFLAAVLLMLAAGCSDGSSPANPTGVSEGRPPANVRLRVLVADDPAIAAAIERRRGEWTAQTEGALYVRETTSADLVKMDRIGADLVIYPARYLGHLVENSLIVPIRPKTVARCGYDKADVLDLVAQQETTWGDEPMALPFGSPVLMVCYRSDLLSRLRRKPPATWQQYAELSKLLAELGPQPPGPASTQSDEPPAEGQPPEPDETPGNEAPSGARLPVAPLAPPVWSGTIEPLGKGWAGRTLLARVAAYARHPNQLAALFDIDTMEPLIAGPPFVRALEELVTAAKLRGPSEMDLDPLEALEALHAGQCGMALTWPTRAAGTRTAALPLGFAELPGAEQVYNRGRQVWEDQPAGAPSRATLLCAAGRLGSVTSTSKNVPAALRLLAWLTSPELSWQISASSPATTLFLRTQMRVMRHWVEKGVDPLAADQYAEQLQSALSRERWISAPRLPGEDEYMDALDAAVLAALRGTSMPKAALQQAAQAWREITARHGKEAQRAAYHRKLKLEL